MVPQGEQPTVNNLIGPGEPLKFLARDSLDPATYPSQQYCAVVSGVSRLGVTYHVLSCNSPEWFFA